MNDHLKNATTLFLGFISSHLLVNCSLIPFGKKDLDENTAVKINTIDQSALTYRAKYGRDYEIDGNVIAKYPHFDLCLFSHKSLPSNAGIIYIYEVSSKDGYFKTHITCDPRDPEKKYFHLEGLHFYYHSNSNGSINIYMPNQLMAQL
jgi:hypothetical protein